MTLTSYKQIIDVVRDLLPTAPLVPNLGTNSSAFMNAGELDNELYLWGGMGLTHSIGLGVALACPAAPVLVVDGDGSLLMGLSGLATIGALSPSNLLHVVLDNQAWGNTGGQATHTARGVDLGRVADACGYVRTGTVASEEDLRSAVQTFVDDPALTMVVVRVDVIDVERPPGNPEPVLIKSRFMAHMAATAADVREQARPGIARHRPEDEA